MYFSDWPILIHLCFVPFQIGEECLACREQAVLFDMSSLGKFYLCGPDAQMAANWLFTADTNRQLGKSVYTCMLNSKAGIEGDVTASAIETGKGNLINPIFKVSPFTIFFFRGNENL